MKKKNFTLLIFAFTLFANSTVFAQGTPPPLTSTITGVIWEDNEVAANGVRNPSERKIASILVKLLKPATFDVVGSALSNANGEFTIKTNPGTYIIEYVYPTDGFSVSPQRAGGDNTLNSAADSDNLTAQFTISANETLNTYGLGLDAKENTITYCTQKESVTTEWTESLILPKSTVTPVPSSVKIFAVEAVNHPNIGIENTASANGYSITAAGKITMTMPINPAPFTMSSDVTFNGALGDYDGTKDYLGASGASFYNNYSFAGNGNSIRSTNSNPTIASTFVGAPNSTFSIPTTAQSSVAITGSGNLETFVQTYVSAGACVVYQYQVGALPITLKTFTAKKQEKASALEWATTTETNSDRFEIERSSNGQIWNNIGIVQAANESSEVSSYHFLDVKPFTGQNLYRLKMVDTDQTFAYSRILNLNFNSQSELTVYPNPASEKLMVNSVSNEEITNIEIYDIVGKLKGRSVANAQYLDIRNLKNGTYFVKVLYKGGHSETQKILVQN